MNDPMKIGVLWGAVGVVFGLVLMFGGRVLIGGDEWFVVWSGMVLMSSIQAARVAYQKGVESQKTS